MTEQKQEKEWITLDEFMAEFYPEEHETEEKEGNKESD